MLLQVVLTRTTSNAFHSEHVYIFDFGPLKTPKANDQGFYMNKSLLHRGNKDTCIAM